MEGTKYDLERFLKAQKADYSTALSEIQAGRKRSHWIWYIFPQIEGLGISATSEYYAIRSLEEARAYLRNSVLHDHLIEISRALLLLESNDPEEVMGWPDNLKLCSSMTLFEAADSKEPVFRQVLEKYYHGKTDYRTIELLKNKKL